MELRICDTCRRMVPHGTACPGCGGPVTLADPECLVGETFGKYHLEEVLSVGGMGVVYRGTHRTLRRPVAVKVVVPQADDDQFRRRFLREARVLAEVKHPNVVEVYDFDVTDWGTPYVVMEYLQGVTLRERMRDRGAMPWSELTPILADVAAGLASVHRRDLVHRDLKPENIFLADFDDRTVAKVLDFGIAKAVGGDRHDTRLTQSGYVVGTLAYLSPEQLLGEKVGPASDQYSLALVVAEALTGRSIRAGKTMGRVISEEIRQPVQLPAEPAGGVPTAVADVIRRATSPAPQGRFADVEELVRALEAAHENDPTVAAPVQPRRAKPAARTRPTVAARPRRRHRWPAMVAGGIALVGAVVATLLLSPDDPEPPVALEQVREFALPMDAGRLLGWGLGLLIATGADDLVVVDQDREGAPSRIPIRPDAVLGVTPDTELVLRRGDAAVIHEVEGSDTAHWAGGLPAGIPLLAGPDTRHLVHVADRELTVYGVGEGTTFSELRRHPLPGRPQVVHVGTRLVAAAAFGRVTAWRLDDGSVLLDRPIDENRIESLAVHDDAELVAVGGWSDRVRVLDANRDIELSIPRRPGADQLLTLEFLYAGPTLAVGERGGITLWRPDEGVVARWDRPGAAIADLLATGGELLALDRSTSTAVILSLGDLRFEQVVKASDRAPWAVAADPAGRVLIGGSGGTLTSLELGSGALTSRTVHTLGITSLATDGERVASASDDRTIAVWRLADLTVEWRSRAHGFLVNQLYLQPERDTLWSTSSDGALKRWSWPELDLLESIDTGDILGRRYALAAVWVGEGGDRAVLGTWNRAVLWLERTDDGWTGRAMPFAPFGGYVVAELPAAGLLVLAGILHPYGMAAIDLDNGELHRLRGSGHAVRALVASASGDAAYAFADSEVLVYVFEPTDDGFLRYELSATPWPGVGTTTAAAALPGGRVAVTNDTGEVLVAALSDFSGPRLCAGVLAN